MTIRFGIYFKGPLRQVLKMATLPREGFGKEHVPCIYSIASRKQTASPILS